MTITNRTFDEIPEEFAVTIQDGRLLFAEYRHSVALAPQNESASEDNPRYIATCNYIALDTAANKGTLTNALMRCKYTEGEEVAAMRKSPDSSDYRSHEIYYRSVLAYVQSLGYVE